MNISQHFTLAEFVTSSSAARIHIDNAPNLDVITKLATGVDKAALKVFGDNLKAEKAKKL